MISDVEVTLPSKDNTADDADITGQTTTGPQVGSGKDELEQQIGRLEQTRNEYLALLDSLGKDLFQLSQQKAAILADIESAHQELSRQQALGATNVATLALSATEKSTLEVEVGKLDEQKNSLAHQIGNMQDILLSVQRQIEDASSRLVELQDQAFVLVRTNSELAAYIQSREDMIAAMNDDSSVESSNSDADAEEVAEQTTETANAVDPKTLKEEDKRTMKEKMYGFMIACLAHPVTKSAAVVVFTAGLLTLGATLANILTLVTVAAISVVGLFAGGYAYHRAQVAKKLQAEKAADQVEAKSPEAKTDNSVGEVTASDAKDTTVNPIETTVRDADDDALKQQPANDDDVVEEEVATVGFRR